MASVGPGEVLAALNREQQRLAVLAWPHILGFIVAATVPAVYVDLTYYYVDSLYFLVGFAIWAMGYLLTLKLLQAGGLLPEGERGGIGSYFVLGLATGLTIGLALIVLVLPGLYLLMRWLPVYGRALTWQDWTGNSMRWSWNATERFQKPLSIALIGPVAFYAIAAAPAVLPDRWFDMVPYELWAVVWNLSSAIGIAWLSVLGVAAFSTISASDSA